VSAPTVGVDGKCCILVIATPVGTNADNSNARRAVVCSGILRNATAPPQRSPSARLYSTWGRIRSRFDASLTDRRRGDLQTRAASFGDVGDSTGGGGGGKKRAQGRMVTHLFCGPPGTYHGDVGPRLIRVGTIEHARDVIPSPLRRRDIPTRRRCLPRPNTRFAKQAADVYGSPRPPPRTITSSRSVQSWGATATATRRHHRSLFSTPNSQSGSYMITSPKRSRERPWPVVNWIRASITVVQRAGQSGRSRRKMSGYARDVLSASTSTARLAASTITDSAWDSTATGRTTRMAAVQPRRTTTVPMALTATLRLRTVEGSRDVVADDHDPVEVPGIRRSRLRLRCIPDQCSSRDRSPPAIAIARQHRIQWYE
jgi:hypothetical protein